MSLNPALQPADVYPAFRWERLINLGELVIAARTWVAEQAVHKDSRCQIGLRGWDHTKFEIVRAAAKEYADWLSIANGGAKFRFRIGGMPVRFCRGDSNAPLPSKYAFADEMEREQVECAFASASIPNWEGFFRLLIEVDNQARPLGVYLVLANLDGTAAMSWRIPRADSDSGNGPTPIVMPQMPVTLGPLTVRPIVVVEAEEKIVAEDIKDAAAKAANKKGA